MRRWTAPADGTAEVELATGIPGNSPGTYLAVCAGSELPRVYVLDQAGGNGTARVKFGEMRAFKIAVTNTGDGALRFLFFAAL